MFILILSEITWCRKDEYGKKLLFAIMGEFFLLPYFFIDDRDGGMLRLICTVVNYCPIQWLDVPSCKASSGTHIKERAIPADSAVWTVGFKTFFRVKDLVKNNLQGFDRDVHDIFKRAIFIAGGQIRQAGVF